MEEEKIMQYQEIIFKLKDISKKIEETKNDITSIEENIEENFLINNKIINNKEFKKVEDLLEENKISINNTINNISSKLD